jgi:UDP-N-acetylglucosamine 1-carboxyvinyltransferase
MQEYFSVTGNGPIKGKVKVSGAKNAALPLLIAGLLSECKSTFKNVPNIHDVHLLLQLLAHLGAIVEREGSLIHISTPKVVSYEASYSLVRALRASFWVLAPLLARARKAKVALPGGDSIGARPVDLHLEGLEKMGAEINVVHGIVEASAPNGLNGADIDLRFPSVGATHQLLLAAALARGKTVIRGAAKEPEVVSLSDMLGRMGARVSGQGTDVIEIEGTDSLRGAEVSVIGDRIEAGTFAMIAAATRGDITIEGFNPHHLGRFIEIMHQMGLDISLSEKGIIVRALGELKPVHLTTEVFPGFATDLQAVTMAALTTIEGESTIKEQIFEGRFGHVAELARMGARISIQDHTAIIQGGAHLSGAPVSGLDIRAAAALVVAALAAQGETKIFDPHHLFRGYDGLDLKLVSLGAKAKLTMENPEENLFSGC